MPARTLGGIGRSSQSAIPVLRAAQCDVAIGSHITYSRASAGTRYTSAGLLATMASGVPRIDYDPVSLAVRGLLIEEQRSNLLTYSEQFDNAAWSRFGTTSVSADSATAPTGTAVADRVNLTSASSGMYLMVAASALTPYVASFHQKASTPQSNFVLINTNLSDPAFLSASVTTAWQRFAVVKTTATGTTIAAGQISDAGAGGTAVDVFGGMLEAATADYPHATSYIPTVAAQATRAADDATITGDAFTALYNAAAWGAFLRFRLTNAVGTRPVLSFDDNTANNRIEVYASGTSLKLRVVTGGAQQCDTTIGTVAANTDYKLAISQDGGAFLCTLNGAAEVSAAAASMPTVDRARLGRNQAGNYLNGHLHTWDAYRRAVPVRERLELTA
jgi:hypothetical protein